MKLVNINYRASVLDGIDSLEFSLHSPQQAKIKVPSKYTLIVFKSGHCRLMGCTKPIHDSCVKVQNVLVKIERIQSITVVVDMQRTYRLSDVASKMKVIFEPELFPAARIMEFNPLCVNLFASGKVVITGLKHLHYYKLVQKIINRIQNA